MESHSRPTAAVLAREGDAERRIKREKEEKLTQKVGKREGRGGGTLAVPSRASPSLSDLYESNTSFPFSSFSVGWADPPSW